VEGQVVAESESKKNSACGKTERRRKKENFLDNGSTVIVPSLAVQHTYEIDVDGRKVKCRTAEAAARLLRELGKEKRSLGMLAWTTHDLEDFVGRIGYFQRLALAELLLKADGGATDEELRKACRASDNRVLSGVLSGISKTALRLDIEPERVYRQIVTYRESKANRRYYAAEGFRKAAKDHGWPDADDLKMREDEG
jgi:hypothetical protein